MKKTLTTLLIIFGAIAANPATSLSKSNMKHSADGIERYEILTAVWLKNDTIVIKPS